MTIKEFSNLCGCNPQTIRYYDRMNLLKPVKVDDWTGYRFYDERQALDFVKIKNLQTAGFTIDEIRQFLDADNETIYEAFTKKIKEQEDKLNAMLEIQKSYQIEITEMTKKIEELRVKIKMRMEDYNPSLEFGIDNATKVIDTDVEKALSDFNEESKNIIESAIAHNEIVLTGPLELESLNIYDARCYKGFLTSRFFLLYKENGETKMFNGDAVIRMKNENTIDTVYRWVS